MKRFKDFLAESKVADDNSPIGFYHISNALDPADLFIELDKLNIYYNHNRFPNIITIEVSDLDQAKIVRDLILSDIFEADDITEEDLHYMTPEEIGDALEIKLKK